MRSLSTLLLMLSFSLCVWSQASVQIIHNSPTPGTSSGPTVDIYVNGALLPELTAVPYRAATAYLDVPAATDIEVGVAVSPSSGPEDAIATFPLGQLVDGVQYTITATGIVGDTDTPFDLAVGGGQTTAGSADNVAIQAYHGGTDAPAVDVDARLVGNLISNLSYGSYSGYLEVPAGLYYLDVRAAGDPNIVATFEADLSGLGGAAANVFASGLLGDTPAFGLFAALPDGTVVELPATEVARLQLIHNSPSPSVDIYVNGALYEDDFVYRTATEFRTVPAGVELDIAVALDNSTGPGDAVAVFEDIVLDNGGTYIVTANGVVGNTDTPFTLAINANAQEAASVPGTVAVSAFHGSPGAPNVDVDARNVGTIINNLAYNNYTAGYLDLPPANFILDVRAAGDPNIVASFQADLTSLTGGAATVFASGFLGDDPAFGLFAALADGTVIELPGVSLATLQIIHNSPSPTVDIYVNGALYEDDFEYLTATGSATVPAGVALEIAVAPETSESADDAIFTTTVTLDNGANYTAIANGIVGDADFPFTIALTDGAQLTGTNPDAIQIRAFHGIPGAPAVDITEAIDEVTLVSALNYGEFTEGYLDAVPGVNFFELRPAGTEELVGTFFTNLTGGDGLSAVVFAGGLLDSEPLFNLYAVLPDGTVLGLLPVSQAQLIHNSPSAIAATVDLYAAVEPLSNEDFGILVDDFSFRTATTFDYFPTRLPITIGVAAGDSNGPEDILFTEGPITFEDGTVYTAIANGIPGDADFPFELAINGDARTASSAPNLVGVTAFHGSPGAPNVDIATRSNGATAIADLPYGDYSGYLEVENVAEFLEVRAAGDPNLVATFNADALSLLGGVSTTVFASGILGDEPAFGLFAALPNGVVAELGSVSRLQVIHNSPDPTVDIYVNGENAIPGLAFRDATPMLDLPTRTPLDIAVVPAGGMLGDAVASLEDVVLEDGKVYLAMASGVVGDAETPFTVVINDQGRDRAADPAQIDLVLFHGAPDAPTVDVVVEDGPVLFDNIEYGTFSDYVGVAPGAYILDVTPAEDNTTVVRKYDADISGLTGGAATVFASGFLSEGEPEFGAWVALIDGTTFPLAEIVATNELIGTLDVYTMFPNPAVSSTTVEFSLLEPTEINLRLVNQEGKVLFTKAFGQLPNGTYREVVDLSNWPAGLYQLQLVNPEGQATRPLLIVK